MSGVCADGIVALLRQHQFNAISQFTLIHPMRKYWFCHSPTVAEAEADLKNLMKTITAGLIFAPGRGRFSYL